MHDKRTPALSWPRLLLAVGVVVFVLVAALALQAAGPMMGDTDTVWLGSIAMPARLFAVLVALALAIVGLVWMLRIVRGLGDEPPPWRHRDR